MIHWINQKLHGSLRGASPQLTSSVMHCTRSSLAARRTQHSYFFFFFTVTWLPRPYLRWRYKAFVWNRQEDVAFPITRHRRPL